MALETGTYISDLVVTNPPGTDPKSQGDDHLRLIKTVLKNSLPGFPGLVIVYGSEAQGATVNDYTVTVSPAPAAYTTPFVIVFKATHTNTSTTTLQINGLGTKSFGRLAGGALQVGDVQNGAFVTAVYDGTSFFLTSGGERSLRHGDTYNGPHNYTSAVLTVATQSAGDNSTNAASTAYVDTAGALKANLASPALTGTPTAPTAAPGTNTTQLASTAYVIAQAFSSALPAQGGAGGKFLTTDGSTASWANITNLVSAKSANFSVAATDRYSLFECTNTITAAVLAAATAGNGFIVYFRNIGTGIITLDPNGSETITTEDGTARATTRLYPKEDAVLIGDGAGWRILRRGGEFVITSTTISGSPTALAITTGFDDPEISRFEFRGQGVTASTASNQADVRVKTGGSFGSALIGPFGPVNNSGPVSFHVGIRFPFATAPLLDGISSQDVAPFVASAGAVLQGIEATWGGTAMSGGIISLVGWR